MSTAIKVTNENVEEVCTDLGNLLDQLEGRDKSFASDLLNGKNGFFTKGKLSDKQMYWVGVLTTKALGIDTTPKAESVGNLEGFIALFEEAKANLKYPKITLDINGEPLKFTLAGPKAKQPGTINITDGGPYGANKWYGRVTKDGTWTPSNQVTDGLRTIISRTLVGFSKDPKSAAMKYGHMSSSCCFCHKKLDTKESVAAGYGPVCADNWGLPWGDV